MAATVREWLEGLGLGRHAETFEANDLGLDLLADLTDADLRDLGVASLGQRKRLLRAIAALHDEAASHSPPRSAERRQLTVMFVDLVGSTELSSRLDPEEMGEVLKAYQNAVTGEVTRFEGHVAKLMGDGVLAYFGWPRAHEDEAERAVRAGLAVVAAVARIAGGGAPLACRVGIATGLVVVGDLVGEGVAREESVVGETPNLAARLQQLAAPGQVVIADGTRRLVGGMFELRELGRQALKGLTEPVAAWGVAGPGRGADRFEMRRAAGLAPLVGRMEELALLEERWAQAKAGDGQVILLPGEAGIGKSRLVEALRERLAEAPHATLAYQCSPHQTQSALFPVRARLEQAAGFQRGDSAKAKLQKLESLLADEMGEASSVVPLLAALAAIPTGDHYAPLSLTPQQLKLKMLAALVTHVEQMAARQCMLLVIEDLHWIDPTSLDLVDMLVDRVRTLPILAVLTFRPDFEPSWVGRPHVTLRTLHALDHRHVALLAEHSAGGKELPAETLELIVARTDGVPLFVEELTKAVVTTGTSTVPATLHDSLMARLDRLAAAKEVAQMAACLGREFSLDHLAALSQLPEEDLRDALDRLARSDLIVPQRPVATGLYVFRHALVQEAAYASLLMTRRQQLHGRIASLIEERYPEIAQVNPEWLARHFAEAGLAKAAAGYWLRAAKRARDAFANREAGAHLRHVLKAVETAAARDLELASALAPQKLEALALLGDIASVAADLDGANRWYGLALEAAQQPSERAWIANKRHRAREVLRDGARIAFYEHGAGQHTLLLVTPIAYSLGTWQPLIERLCQEFRIVTIDARGCGGSDLLARPYPIREHIRDVRAVIGALGDARIIGIGMSRGANMVLRLAHGEPGLFEKLVLVGGAPSPPKSPFFSDSYLQGCRDALDRGDLEALLRFHTAHALSEPEMTEVRELVVRSRLQLPHDTILSFWDPDPTIDVARILPEIDVPTLVTHGREDRLVLFNAAEALAARLPRAQLYAFEGKGHFPIFTATDEFCEVLRRFVRTGAVVKRSA